MTRWLATTLLLIACGDSGGGNTNPDAPVDAAQVDAARLDAPLFDSNAIDSSGEGTLHFTWEIRIGTPTGPLATCAPSNETIAADLGNGLIFTTPCPQGSAGGTVEFPNVPMGTYDVTVSLRMGTTAESQTTVNGVPILDGRITDIGHIIFVVAQLRR